MQVYACDKKRNKNKNYAICVKWKQIERLFEYKCVCALAVKHAMSFFCFSFKLRYFWHWAGQAMFTKIIFEAPGLKSSDIYFTSAVSFALFHYSRIIFTISYNNNSTSNSTLYKILATEASQTLISLFLPIRHTRHGFHFLVTGISWFF